MYALPKRCPLTGLFIPNPIYSTKPHSHHECSNSTASHMSPDSF
ncbi:hypothetical protein [Serratia symbiotica]